jgi:hypothetical protein
MSTKNELIKALEDLLDSPDLNLDSLEQSTRDAIDKAVQVLKKAKKS